MATKHLVEGEELRLPEDTTKKNLFGTKKFYLGGLAILVTLVICAVVFYYQEQVMHLQGYGYFGIFITSLIAASIVVIPIPYAAVVFTMGGILDPALVGLVSGVGAGIGALSIHMTGHLGHSVFSKGDNSIQTRLSKWKFYSRMVDWAQRKGALGIFVMSAAINPLFIPMTMATGALRYPLWKFFLACTAGKIVKSLLFAYAGYLGLSSILRLLG